MGLYGNFTTREQWDLHAYFAPTKKMNDTDLRQSAKRRQRLTPHSPSVQARSCRGFTTSTTQSSIHPLESSFLQQGRRRDAVKLTGMSS